MSAALITSDAWKALTTAARRARGPSSIAVAYLGSGASRLLPLNPGSRLVVDASEPAIKAGQTNPTELSRFLQRRVRVYSVPNLHSKVFVLGRAAFIGSANVSTHSATSLVEAVLRTREPAVVGAAKRFVRDLCVHELGPEALKRLSKLYRPPRFIGRAGTRRKTRRVVQPELPRLQLAQLKPADPPEASQATEARARAIAKSRRKHQRSHTLDEFFITGRCGYQHGDTVIQIFNEDGNAAMVLPPGNVVHVRRWSDGHRRITFVFLEVPKRRRVRLDRFAHRLGPRSAKKLRRHGLIRDYTFGRQVLSAWQR